MTYFIEPGVLEHIQGSESGGPGLNTTALVDLILLQYLGIMIKTKKQNNQKL